MKKQLTDWYPAEVKPVRKGWYERNWHFSFASLDWFDGMDWHNGIGDGDFDPDPSSAHIKWRGLASDPNA